MTLQDKDLVMSRKLLHRIMKIETSSLKGLTIIVLQNQDSGPLSCICLDSSWQTKSCKITRKIHNFRYLLVLAPVKSIICFTESSFLVNQNCNNLKLSYYLWNQEWYVVTVLKIRTIHFGIFVKRGKQSVMWRHLSQIFCHIIYLAGNFTKRTIY